MQPAVFGLFFEQTMSKLDKADMLVPLQALAGQIKVFPTAQRLDVMAMLALQHRNSPDPQLQALTLDPPQQARLLATLSEGIRSMGDGGQMTAFNVLRGMTLGLPSEHRLPSLEALSRQVHELPANERAESLWTIRSEIQDVAADPLFAGRVALKVAGTLAMPDEDRAWLLGSIVHRSVDLPEGPRATLLGEVRQVVAGAQWPGAEDVRQRLDAAGH
jgi:hypothetical protein